jgi:diguanylate cyclase (GGDEF)-like protein
MKKMIPVLAIILGWSSVTAAAPAGTLTDLHSIHALTNVEASHGLFVSFEATITYFRSYEKTMFVQDGDVAIYVQATTGAKLVPGDRILIKGTTRGSFRPFVSSNDITLLRLGALPKPVPTTYDELIRAQQDCKLVTVRARIRAADVQLSSDVRSTSLQMLTEGGTIDAIVDSGNLSDSGGLLDDEVEITGAASGKFDGKMEQTGILLHVSSFANIKILKRTGVSSSSLPVTQMDEILTGYHVNVLSQRIRVSGTVTYYQPGSAVVLQNGAKSLWIQTRTTNPIRLGDLADATGFPGLHDGFLTLTNGAIWDSNLQAPVSPRPATWRQLALSGNVFDLVSIEGKVVTVVREAAQDEYVLVSDGQMFSAIYRHPPPTTLVPVPPPPMKEIPIGSRIRVTGICMLDDSNPFNAQVPFTILMRSYDDIAVVARPTWLSVNNLMMLVGVLLVVVVAGGARGWTVERKVRKQVGAMAYVESRRSRILEDINGSRPLAEILEQITELISFKLRGAPCWCQVADGARLGNCPPKLTTLRIVQTEIPARTGSPLGTLFVALDSRTKPGPEEAEGLSVGAGLAALSIESRRVYSDLLHRSEFDLLTDVHNRFSLDKLLDATIDGARERATIFGLIYIDLDKFKRVNDRYGHQIGDLYLREIAIRMKLQLRSFDSLARIGGDEFAALVPVVHNRSDVEEIAERLERCFDDAFNIDGVVLRGSASVGFAIYPEDGSTKDSLLNAADAAMYAAKNGNNRRKLASRMGA